MATKKKTIDMIGNDDSLLIDELREFTSTSDKYTLRHESGFDVQYPTGFLNVDFMNGLRVHVYNEAKGLDFKYDSIGIVDGSINMFIGRSGSGKSTIMKQWAAKIIRPYKHGVIVEASIEGGIVSRRNEILTGFSPMELKKKLRSRNEGVSIESCYDEIKAIRDLKIKKEDKYRYNTGLVDSLGYDIYKFQPTVYIIDSLAMLVPEKLTQEEELSGQMSTTATAKSLATFFRRITPILKEANIILFISNHITQQVDINPYAHAKTQNRFLKQGETTPGGVTPFLLSNNIFRLDDNTKLTNDKEFGIDGCIVTISMVKSRTNTAGSSTLLVFNPQAGFDPDLSLYLMLKDNGYINGAGAYLYIEDRDDKKFSQKQLKQKLIEDPEFTGIFVNACVKCLESSLDKDEAIINASKDISTNAILQAINQINK